jgi:LEA14-like dessication related protein
MKKGLLIVLGLVVAFIVWMLVKSKQWANEVKYGVADGWKLLKIGVTEVTVLIPIYIYNPTPFNAIVSDLDLQIYFDGFYLATVRTPGNYALKPKQNSTYPLTFTVSNGQMLKYLGERGYVINDPNWMKNVKVTVVGTVSADVGILKLSKKRVELNQTLKDYT